MVAENTATENEVEACMRVRRADNVTAGQLATQHETTNKDVFTAALRLLVACSPKRQRALVDQVLIDFPRPYRRIGRGNRKEKVPA